MAAQRQLDFDYDLWANKKWLAASPQMEHAERALQILHHVAVAQWLWLQRVQDAVGDKSPRLSEPVELREAVFVELHDAWLKLLHGFAESSEVAYSSSSGKHYSNTLGEITMHVLNHGTYHRGQLRGLAEAEGFEEFQDTDYIHFARG